MQGLDEIERQEKRKRRISKSIRRCERIINDGRNQGRCRDWTELKGMKREKDRLLTVQTEMLKNDDGRKGDAWI